MRAIAKLWNRWPLWLVMMACALSTACRDTAPAPTFDHPLSGHISIEHLKTLAHGASTSIVSDIFIEGYVVANDLFGEYYKSIVICDESGGIEISIDSRRLAYIFHIGARVVVDCSSLALGNYGGQLTLGAQPTGEYSVDRIAELDIARYFTIDESAPHTITPREITITDLSPELVGDYVMLSDVTFGEQAGLAWCDTDPATGDFIATKRLLIDRAGNELYLTFMASCTYAAEEIPSGYGRVCGIVEYFNGEYSLRVINRMIGF